MQRPGPKRGHTVVAVFGVDRGIGGRTATQPLQRERRLQPTGVLGVVNRDDAVLAGALDVRYRVVTKVNDPGWRHARGGQHMGEQALALAHTGVAGGEDLGELDPRELRPAQQPAELVRGEIGVRDQVHRPAEFGDREFGELGDGEVGAADIALEGDLHGDQIVDVTAAGDGGHERRPDLVEACLQGAPQ